jgi:hypothetical protein
VKRRERDAARALALRPQLGEDHLDPLRVRVCARAVVLAPLELEIVGSQARRVHAAGRGEHDTGGGPRAQRREQQIGEQERPQHVGREGEFVTLGGAAAARRQDAGVVEDTVELGGARREVGGEAAHRVEVGEVAALELEPRARLDAGVLELRADALERRRAALGVARHHVDAGAEPSEPLDRRLADPRADAGDEHRAPRERAGGDVAVPGGGPEPVAERRVPREHGPVEGPVERARDHGRCLERWSSTIPHTITPSAAATNANTTIP